MIRLRSWFAVSIALSGTGIALANAGCGAGQYGFARTYVPLEEETPFVASSKELPYEEVTSDPAAHEGTQIAWFGVVEAATLGDDGKHRLTLSYRKHQPRHLCDSEAEDSCRVTVSAAAQGSFTAVVQLDVEDTVPGLDKLQPGSLLRVFGKVRCHMNEEEHQECDLDERGGVILYVDYYRHWPARYYATTRSAGSLKR